MLHRRSVILAYIGVFSSLSIVLAISRVEISYPLLPYLKFDFAEVPVMIVFMLCGPVPAIVAEIIHWMGLTFRSGAWIGPLMKFLAVISMIIGFWIGIKIGTKVMREKAGSLKIFLFGTIFGALLRVIVCTFTNIALFLYIDPRYLQFTGTILRAMGLNVSSSLDILTWTLIFTGIFNMAHVPLSSVTSLLILKAALKKIPAIARSIWFLQL
ncbi:ECF transporter S component [Candidatus Bathyarchaeota archaeon]|nr:ECF transporter S component [Candidatus Bathyarchaeota archaeon]